MKRLRWRTFGIILGLMVMMVSLPFILHPMIRTMEPPQVVHYDMDFGELNQSERDVALAGAAIAFASWEKDNTGLVFQEGGGMKIMFVDWLSIIRLITISQINGIALCPFWENSENHCCILISSDVVRVSQDAGYNEIHTAYILAHEIGHVLGFMHTDVDNHLMNGPGGWVFDNTSEQEHAFVIPEPSSLYD